MGEDVLIIFNVNQKTVQVHLYKIKIIKYALEKLLEQLVLILKNATLIWHADHQTYGHILQHVKL